METVLLQNTGIWKLEQRDQYGKVRIHTYIQIIRL